jgi:predicted transposase YbfD/YdcC
LLVDIIVLGICGVIANCDDWKDIELFAKERICWFKRFLKLPHGIPSHDTFERVFAKLDPAAFERCCVGWLRDAAQLIGAGHIAIDGKTICGSGNASIRPLHLVSAWATEAQLTLGQVAVDGKSNEITAIPQLLELLDLHGALVTIDAIGCQKEIVKKIRAKGGDYLLVVKGNQERLLEDVQNILEQAMEKDPGTRAYFQDETSGHGHGREECRSCVIVHDVEGVRDLDAWPGLTTVGMCYSERTCNGKTTEDTRYFIASGKMGVRRYAKVLRAHWGIENNLHWQLDITFGEDRRRIQERCAAANFALLRKMALSLLKRNPRKDSIARKRKKASLDPDYLAEILTGPTNLEKV